MTIIYKSQNETKFSLKWQEYLNNNLVSYKYTLLNLEYFLLYSQYLLEDKSFVVIENNKCVGICFLPIEQKNRIATVSIAMGYVFAPLAKNKRIYKKIFYEIEDVTQTFHIQKISLALDPLILEYGEKFNSLLQFGFIDTSTSDCLVDLRKPKDELWRNLRKSYKGLINNLIKNKDFDIIVIHKNNPNYLIHENYRKLHEKCAGRITRAKATFDKQYEMLENNSATLIGLKYNNTFIGFNYFFHHGKTVIYASGADDPIYENSKLPIYHSILWAAQEHFKNEGYEFIEFSQPCGYNKVNGFNDYLNDKQINISNFKRGMGTKMVPAFRGIKYLNKSLLLEDILIFQEQGTLHE